LAALDFGRRCAEDCSPYQLYVFIHRARSRRFRLRLWASAFAKATADKSARQARLIKLQEDLKMIEFVLQGRISGTRSGCGDSLRLFRGWSLRSTPGYFLASLRDAQGKLIKAIKGWEQSVTMGWRKCFVGSWASAAEGRRTPRRFAAGSGAGQPSMAYC